MSMPAEDPAAAAASKQRETILKANREAARYYHACLKDEKLGLAAREYIAKRRLSAATVTHFGLGFAPDGWDNLVKHLKYKGFSEADIITSGLARRSKTGGAIDFFRNRLIFPIIDLRGNVIAFGGRVLDNSLPKYLNSSDTPVFSKKNNLFALNFAKNKGNDRLILAEGYMDVISMHQAGFTEAVATLGTAITPEQARIMSRYAKKIVVAYDTDRAGQEAVKKANRLFGELSVDVKILAVSEGKDPDEFIRENGAEKFEMLLEGAKSRLDYELGILRKTVDLKTPEGKINYLREAVKSVAKEHSAVTREVYAAVLAGETGVSAEQIKKDIDKVVGINGKKEALNEIKEAEKKLAVPDVYGDRSLEMRTVKAEEGIIAALLKNNDYLNTVDGVGPDLFITEKNRRVFEAVAERIKNGEETEIYSFAGDLSPEDISHLAAIDARSRLTQKFTKRETADYVAVLKEASEVKSAGPLNELSDDEFRKLFKKK
ncbi:MAG: DNA primase, partial [Clostridia bacterium]|nr:DNA primase [Clostridia bacterium]